MKILHVYHTYPAVFGGVSKVVYDVTRGLRKKGHEVSVLATDFYTNNINAIRSEKNNGVRIYRVPTILKTFARTNKIALLQPSSIYLVKGIIKNLAHVLLHNY